MKAFKVSEEQAELEFNEFADAHDIDIDVDNMPEKYAQGFLEQKSRIIRGIRRGAVTFEDDLPIVTVGEKEFKFREPTPSDFMHGNRLKGNEHAQVCATLASMTGTDASAFSSMNMRMYGVCAAFIVLFTV